MNTLTILESFNYFRSSALRAMLPFHLLFGKGKRIDRDLYNILLLIGLADKNEANSDAEAGALPKLIERFEDKQNIENLLKELLDIFSYFALNRNNQPILKRFKKHLRRFAKKCDYEIHIVNVAKMAQHKVDFDSEDYNFQVWYDSYVPRSYKLTQQAGEEQTFSELSKKIHQTLKDHSSYFVLRKGDLIYKKSEQHIAKQKALKKKHQGIWLGLALLLGGFSLLGNALGPLFLSDLGPIFLQLPLYFTSFYLLIGLPVFVYGTYQALRLLFTGEFFKNLDGSEMSTKELVGVGVIFFFCLCAALITGLVTLSFMALKLPVIAGVLSAFTVACATLSSWELCSDIYRVGISQSFKKYWQRIFDHRLPLSQRILRGVALLLAAAAVITILIVSLPYVGGFVASVFAGLGLAPTVVTAITTTLLALAAPVMTFQYTYYFTRTLVGVLDVAHSAVAETIDIARNVVAPKIKKGVLFIVEKCIDLLSFCKPKLIDPPTLKLENPPPSYAEAKKARLEKSKEQIQFFMRLQKFRAVAGYTFLQICQGAPTFYNQFLPANTQPNNLLPLTRRLGIPDHVANFAVNNLATTSVTPSIDETGMNAVDTHEMLPARHAPSLSAHQGWAPDFFKNPPTHKFEHRDAFVLESNPMPLQPSRA